MSDDATGIPEALWSGVQAQLRYSAEEMQRFRADPRNARVLGAVPALASKTVVFEVVHASHCASQHDVGTRFFYSADGNLLTRLAPKRVCAFLLPAMTQAVFAVQELVYAGADPVDLAFRHAGCSDVGLACGGWGRVVVEARVLPKDEARALYCG